MNIEYSYRIDGIDIAPSLDNLKKVITRIGFTYIGKDSESGFDGNFFDRLDFLNPDPENFTPFDDVTENECIKWVEDKWNSVDMAKKSIENQIESKITPMFKSVDTPWGEPMLNNPTE